MALPTPTNTWLISPNNTSYTNGSNNTDSIGRRKDIADFLGILATQLIALGATAGVVVTCVGSSDGVTNSPSASAPTLNGANLWLQGSTDFRNGVYNVIASPYYQQIGSCWIILQLGNSVVSANPQIAITFGQNDGSIYGGPKNWYIHYSPNGIFAAPTTRCERPFAQDEVLLSYWGGLTSEGGLFNQDGLGIVNTSNSYTSYTQQVHVGLGLNTSTGQPTGFYAVSYHSFFPGFLIWVGGLDNGVVGTVSPYRDWSKAKACFTSGNFSQRNLVGPYGDASGLMIRSTFQPNGIRALMPSGPNFDGGTNSSNYQSVAYNPVSYNAIPDLDTGLLPVLPIGAFSHDYKGIKGTFSDIWWGASNGNANVYPSSGPIEFIQVNDVILPWNTTVANPVFTG